LRASAEWLAPVAGAGLLAADGSCVEVVEGGPRDPLEPSVPVRSRECVPGPPDRERSAEAGPDAGRRLDVRRGEAPVPGGQELPGSA
ncbi:hypothetical protein, partial [Streptomyces sp. uw30]|uniref:hypothetical protein n=1 Tax=Streptomyces sp. uw30 TaxID=1828179 RepID=UPI001C9BC4CB